MRITILLASILIGSVVFAQQNNSTSPLLLSDIMKGNEFIGHQPEGIRWTADSKFILFEWNPDNQPGNETYAYDLSTKKTFKINPEFYLEHPESFETGTGTIDCFIHNGDLYRTTASDVILVFNSSSGIRNLQKSDKNPNVVHFQSGLELYAYHTENHSIQLIATFKKGSAPVAKKELNHWEQEELELFEYLQDERQKKKWNESKRERWNQTTAEIYFGKKSVSNIQIDPNHRFITYRIDDYPNNPKTHVENHISASGHTYTSDARPKVSQNDPNHQLGIYDLERDTNFFVDFSTLSNIRKKPAYLADYGETGTYEKDRNIIMHSMIYSKDGNYNILDVRSYDNKDRWIVSVDLLTGKITELETQHDEAWIGGPGISNWNMVPGNLGWLNDNSTFYFQSEVTGYSHLYTKNIRTGAREALTEGNWEVHEAEYNAERNLFYLTSNKTHPGDRSFYHLRVSDKAMFPILEQGGNHEVTISPDKKWLAVRYSAKNKPWELYFAKNQTKNTLVQITQSTTEAFKAYEWFAPDVISFKAEDGTNVNARLYQPEQKNGAAVIFVHGAGYLQNAHNWWSGYYREYMFHNYLRDNGFTVLDIDYRASKGYGRDHRTDIYRHMGGKDLSDHIDGRTYLIEELGIDPERIGIYGGSYGGFITLMALLTEPGKFKAGAAIRSVTDWFHYNHEYTSNILNYPETDPNAYKKSSPIYFAENLQDHLLILHGMVDDNVQFQDVVRLSQRFIELGKKNWEMAIYPVEPHGFKKASSWTDEYGRIYDLFYEELILNAQ